MQIFQNLNHPVTGEVVMKFLYHTQDSEKIIQVLMLSVAQDFKNIPT